MGTSRSRHFRLPDPAATDRLAAALAALCRAGDTILLNGPVGAGKTQFARAFITQKLTDAGAPAEDIPSPTFTLVQTYTTGDTEIWHADLYRLGSPDEVMELGLDTAFEDAIVLIEWPDRLGDAAPPDALRLTLAPTPDDQRSVTAEGGARWQTRLDQLEPLGA